MSGTLAVLGAVGAAFNPKSIANLILWFDPADASTITLGTPPAISVWTEKSGHGNSATQSTAGNRPQLETAALNSLNTVSVSSGGSGQFMTLTNPVSVTAGYTAVMVAKYPGTQFCAFGASAGTNIYIPTWQGSVFFSGTAGRSNTTSQVSANTFFILTIAKNAAEDTGTVRVNGSPVAVTDTAGNSGSNTGIDQLFNSLNGGLSDGHVGDLLLYNRLLTSGEMTLVENYENKKWAIF